MIGLNHLEFLYNLYFSEGAQVSECDSANTVVEGGSFKYFRGKFETSAKKVTIEVIDIRGIFLIVVIWFAAQFQESQFNRFTSVQCFIVINPLPTGGSKVPTALHICIQNPNCMY